MAPPIEDTIPDIPITCRRAPAEAARSLRLNRNVGHRHFKPDQKHLCLVIGVHWKVQH